MFSHATAPAVMFSYLRFALWARAWHADAAPIVLAEEGDGCGEDDRPL